MVDEKRSEKVEPQLQDLDVRNAAKVKGGATKTYVQEQVDN